MSPFNFSDVLGHNNWIFLLIGIGFGFALEVSGFGDSRRLAAQFYFYEMRVLKVMFTAIVTAMLLVFLATSLGALDFSKVYVNPTYLWPGIVGGLVMGTGFIIGGFCPGTSIVGASTLKIDALVFLGGVVFGVFLFGESAPHMDTFFNSSFYGRLTLFDLFNTDAGKVVFAVVLFALIAFFFAEWGEKKMGILVHEKTDLSRYGKTAVAVLSLLIAGAVLLKGQPQAEDRWKWIADKETPALLERAYYIHPMELRDLMINPDISLQIIDLRSESDYNLFHLENSMLVSPDGILTPQWTKKLLLAPPQRIVVLVGNDDTLATETWKKLRGLDVINLYILDGGLNSWLKVFPLDERIANRLPDHQLESWSYRFTRAVGESQFSSYPYDPVHLDKNISLNYVKKVKMQAKSAVKGGCG